VERNPDSPWNPRVPVDITPAEFEEWVLEWLRRAASAEGQRIHAQHLAVVHGDGGDYRIDVLVTFSVLGGAEFVVLVECKHHKRPVEREDLMVLESKLRDVNAQKGMLFSTSGFQEGALGFARAKHLATVNVIDGTWQYETRALGPSAPPPSWIHFDRFVGVRMTELDNGIGCHAVDLEHLDALREWLRAEVT
jgi:restriction system protein